MKKPVSLAKRPRSIDVAAARGGANGADGEAAAAAATTTSHSSHDDTKKGIAGNIR